MSLVTNRIKKWVTFYVGNGNIGLQDFVGMDLMHFTCAAVTKSTNGLLTRFSYSKSVKLFRKVYSSSVVWVFQ